MPEGRSRDDQMTYRRCGRSGLLLPAISLGAWYTFGGYRAEPDARAVVLRAFDLGVTHLDLANNYGSPPGNAEEVCGRILSELPRHEIVVSSKAGYRMWPGPYGEWGSRKHLVSSCDQSLRRTGLDHFDVFYSHRPDPATPLEETLGALDHLVRQGKALYVGVSSYDGAQFTEALRVVEREGFTRILVHQPFYNMLARGMETDLLPHVDRAGVGVVAFCPLASGLLTDRHLDGSVDPNSRAATEWTAAWVRRTAPEERSRVLRGLDAIAAARGQSLAQMALAWLLRLPQLTSAVIGASRVEQLEHDLAALDRLQFSAEELAAIDRLTLAGQPRP